MRSFIQGDLKVPQASVTVKPHYAQQSHPPSKTTVPDQSPHRPLNESVLKLLELEQKEINRARLHRKVLSTTAPHVFTSRLGDITAYRNDSMSQEYERLKRIDTALGACVLISPVLHGLLEVARRSVNYFDGFTDKMYHNVSLIVALALMVKAASKLVLRIKGQNALNHLLALDQVDMKPVKAWLKKEEEVLRSLIKKNYQGVNFEYLDATQVDALLQRQENNQHTYSNNQAVKRFFALDPLILTHLVKTYCDTEASLSELQKLSPRNKQTLLRKFRLSLAQEAQLYINQSVPAQSVRDLYQKTQQPLPRQLEQDLNELESTPEPRVPPELVRQLSPRRLKVTKEDHLSNSFEVTPKRKGPKIKTRPDGLKRQEKESTPPPLGPTPVTLTESTQSDDTCVLTFSPAKMLQTPGGGQLPVAQISVLGKPFKKTGALQERFLTLLREADSVLAEPNSVNRNGLIMIKPKQESDQLYFKVKILGAHGDSRLWSSTAYDPKIQSIEFDNLGDHERFKRFRLDLS